MKQPILTIDNLSVSYMNHDQSQTQALHKATIKLWPSETLGIIGESGSGKSTLALAVMGLLGKNVQLEGQITYDEVVLSDLSQHKYDYYRWKHISLVYQNGLDVLNPSMTIEAQIIEPLILHLHLSKKEAQLRVTELLSMVGLEEYHKYTYPHQLSGGMRQKVLIAMALACQAEVLIVDEPTMSLDTLSKREIITLLKRLQKEQGFAMLIISHEFQVIDELADRVAVMYAGHIVEEGSTKDIIKKPLHPYTSGLITSSPAINPYRDLWGIPGTFENSKGIHCPFCNRCTQAIDQCFHSMPLLEETDNKRHIACHRGGIVTLLECNNVQKQYHVKNKLITACEDCSLRVRAGEIVTLIGQSGSGKTTIAEIISGIVKADNGTVFFKGNLVCANSETSKKGGMQIIFQDPFSSINENLTVAQIVREPLDILKEDSLKKRHEAVIKALSETHLPYDELFLSRCGHTLSGGQRQRLAIARALVMEPTLLIADEISAMLDPSTSANIIRHLKYLQNKKGFSMLYITHDLNMAQKISDWIYVMKQGEIIENGPSSKIFTSPCHEYTKELVREIISH